MQQLLTLDPGLASLDAGDPEALYRLVGRHLDERPGQAYDE